MRVKILALKPTLRFIDFLVMALAAYFALHAGSLRPNTPNSTIAPASFIQLS